MDHQNMFNGLTVLTFLILVIFLIMYMRQSKRLTLFDLAEFQTVPDSLRQDYVNKTVPVIQDAIKKNLTDKGLLGEGSIIANSIVYAPCRVAKFLGTHKKDLPSPLCDNYCEGDTDGCLIKSSNGNFDLGESGFCNNFQCQKVSDNSCESDVDCVFENTGKLQVCKDEKCAFYKDICDTTGPPSSTSTPLPKIYPDDAINCNNTHQPLDFNTDICYKIKKPFTIPNPLGGDPIVLAQTCKPSQMCYVPDGKFYGSCLNKQPKA